MNDKTKLFYNFGAKIQMLKCFVAMNWFLRGNSKFPQGLILNTNILTHPQNNWIYFVRENSNKIIFAMEYNSIKCPLFLIKFHYLFLISETTAAAAVISPKSVISFPFEIVVLHPRRFRFLLMPRQDFSPIKSFPSSKLFKSKAKSDFIVVASHFSIR